MNTNEIKLNDDKKLFFLVFVIALSVFLFTTDAHRYTIDEDITEQEAIRIATQEPNPLYVQGKSSTLFEYPDIFPLDAPWYHPGPICLNAVLCSKSEIGHSLTEAPFLLINHNLHIITKETVVWTVEDFNDPHYVYWRNNIDPDFTFLELFYAPVFSALSVGVFFLICRTFNFDQKNSLILAFLYGFTTMVWAYSKTSLNVVPTIFFVLLGFLYFRKFQKNQSPINLILCGTSLGFGFLVRPDAVLFIIPLFFFLLYHIKNQNYKIKKFFSFVVPVISSYVIHAAIPVIRFGISPASTVTSDSQGFFLLYIQDNLLQTIFGLLLSPGVGVLIFVPLLFTVFFSFPDFYKKNKSECLLFLSFTILFLFYYGTSIGGERFGLVAWGARYLLPVIPFLLLPLGASIEKRKSKILKITLVILGGFGFFFNLAYVVQDVSWFVWCRPGCTHGLFSLGNYMTDLYIHDAVIWTFEFSQLTHSIITAFTALQYDIFLLKVLGPIAYGLTFTSIVTALIYFLFRLLQKQPTHTNSLYEKNKSFL